MSRSDLLALDDDALATLANRGLAKRARREVERGDGPSVDEADDGTVIGRFADGVRTDLAPGVALRDTLCTCAASPCRHRLATVMALRMAAPRAETQTPGWPPFEVSDEVLEQRLGRRGLRRGQRLLAAGLTAHVVLGPVPSVLLPTCTVTFLVPWDLAHTRCDCVEGIGCAHVALAVWAIRAIADPTPGTEHHVPLGAPSDDSPVHALDRLLDDILRAGWPTAHEALRTRVERARPQLIAQGATWVDDLLDQLLHDVSTYLDGAQEADADAVADALGELHLRLSATPSSDLPRGHVIGDRQEGRTKLDHTVLHGAGARVRDRGSERTMSIFVFDGDRSEALVHDAHTPAAGGPMGKAFGDRRMWKSTARQVATGRVVTKGAHRRPNRQVDVTGTMTSVMPAPGDALEPRVEALDEVQMRLARRVPAAWSPRLRAWNVIVGKARGLQGPFWDAATRTAWAVVGDALLIAEWRAEAPGRPAAFIEHLTEGVVFTAEARLVGGQLVLDPLLIDGVALDLCTEQPIPGVPAAPRPSPEGPLELLLRQVRRCLSAIAVHGVMQPRRSTLATLDTLVQQARSSGLYSLAQHLDVLRVPDPELGALRWRRAWARLALLEHASSSPVR